MSLNPQAPAANQHSTLLEELTSKLEAYSQRMEDDWKDDEEFGIAWDEPDLDFLYEAEEAPAILSGYEEKTLVSLSESGMPEGTLLALIQSEYNETSVREIAHYYPAIQGFFDEDAMGFFDEDTVEILRSIFFVGDLSSLRKGTPNYEAVSTLLSAVIRFNKDRISRPSSDSEGHEEDADDFDFLMTDGTDEDRAMTPHLADIILRFPDDFERIAHYIGIRKIHLGEVDTGHLEAFLAAPAASLGEGVL